MKLIKVKPWGEGQGDFVHINEEDFNPDFHELLDEAGKSGKALSIDEIRAALNAKGVTFEAGAKKPALQKLLDDTNKAEDLKTKLTEKGVDFTAAVTLEDLQKLLDEAV
ncbi:hypothetical protein [Pseudomonas sp. MRSN 12121]|uniref:hypothetical protein n=1 Tax=Pseudomonas sp. MRSN 12121 TaxID=1611770 RepID=UPI000697B7CD|nr:hypothetical protein [Pseudomonas sp. MRSN 12121]